MRKPFAPDTVGKRISTARRLLGVAKGADILVPEIAKQLGVTNNAVYAWEADESVPREEALERLAALLGVTPAYLRYGVTEAVDVRPGDIRPAQPISGMGSVPPGVPITPDVPQQKKGKGGGR